LNPVTLQLTGPTFQEASPDKKNPRDRRVARPQLGWTEIAYAIVTVILGTGVQKLARNPVSRTELLGSHERPDEQAKRDPAPHMALDLFLGGWTTEYGLVDRNDVPAAHRVAVTIAFGKDLDQFGLVTTEHRTDTLTRIT
jgi:hypothetical protein